MLEGAPEYERQEADEDMGLGPVLFLMVNGTQSQIVFADAETVFDLGQADVDAPECFGRISLQIGTQ